jgi:hypothetical protein
MGYIKQLLGSAQRYNHLFRDEDYLWAIAAIAILAAIWISVAL